jgi:cytochrome c biogenesis protein CcmG/thiol:disulfide interchange protein DsbE
VVMHPHRLLQTISRLRILYVEGPASTGASVHWQPERTLGSGEADEGMIVKREAEESEIKDGRSTKSSQYLIFVVALIIVGATLVYAVAGRGSAPLREGPAPDFTLELFDGGQLSLNELRGQVVVLNFWASWCPPCRQEAPILEAVSEQYRGQGVTFVGLNYEDADSPARAFVEEFGITYPNGPDVRSRIARVYGVQGVPETFIINPEGEIAEVFIGSPTEAQLTAVLDWLLAPGI